VKAFAVVTVALTLLLGAPAIDVRAQQSWSGPEPEASGGSQVEVGEGPYFEAYGPIAPTRSFVVEASADGRRGPSGRFESPVRLCTLEANYWVSGSDYHFECYAPDAVARSMRRGSWQWNVVDAACPDQPGCVSPTTGRFSVVGTMGPTDVRLRRRRVKARASRLERAPLRAGGRGYPAAALLPLRCVDRRNPAPLETLRLRPSADCAGDLLVRTIARVPLGKGRRRRAIMGRTAFTSSIYQRGGIWVHLDGNRISVSRALAIERLLRKRRRLRVEIRIRWRDRSGKLSRKRVVARLVAPRKRPRGCRTGCLQP